MKVKALTFLLSLSILLNIALLYLAFDQGISAAYNKQTISDSKEVLTQITNMLPIVLQKHESYTQNDVIAKTNIRGFEPFEKEGYIWVGQLGLDFNEVGKLEAIKIPHYLNSAEEME